MLLEKIFKQRARKKLNELGGWWYSTSDKFQNGIPDIIGCYKGKFIIMELKVGDNKVTDLQKYTVNKCIENGAIGFTEVKPNDFADVLTELRKL